MASISRAIGQSGFPLAKKEFNPKEAFYIRNLIASNQMKFGAFTFFDPGAKDDKHDKVSSIMVWALMNQYARRCWAKKCVVFEMGWKLAIACGCSLFQVQRLQRAAIAQGLLQPVYINAQGFAASDGEQKRSRLGAPKFFVDADAIEEWLSREMPADYQIKLAAQLRSCKRNTAIDPEDAEEERLMYEAEDLSVPAEDDGLNTVEEFLDRSAITDTDGLD